MQLYGLIGRKLGHSFSAEYFNEKFRKEKLNAAYKLFEIPSVEGVLNIILGSSELRGLNVTIPYKKSVIPFLDDMTSEAREIGAVNCIRVLRGENGKPIMIGHNTDAPGFKMAISPLISENMKKALVLGQGGASLAIIYVLKSMGIEVTKVSRTRGEDRIEYSDLSEDILKSHKIIVNCTPLGMYPDSETYPPVPYHLLTPEHLCFDLVYNPQLTEFMKRSMQAGANVSNGLGMLHNQADLAWDFWNNPLI